jgi:hypothetical protein
VHCSLVGATELGIELRAVGHTPSHTITRYHTPSHTITRYHTSSHIITRYHTSSHIITRYHTSSHAITRYHTSSHTIMCHHTSSHIITRYHTGGRDDGKGWGRSLKSLRKNFGKSFHLVRACVRSGDNTCVHTRECSSIMLTW